MSNRRKSLIDRMIRIYGFEHPIVIEFCKLCESYADNEWDDQCLTILVEVHEANPRMDIDTEANE